MFLSRRPVPIKAILCVFCLLFPLAVGAEIPSEMRREILRKGGLLVQIGAADATLTANLAANDRSLLRVLETNSTRLEKARRDIQDLGLYGQVTVERFDGKRLPYAENLVNLIVAPEGLGGVPLEEVLRVLAPLGSAYIATDGRWKKTLKPWPEDIDEWTHWMHGADGNPVAQDTVVGPPRRLQWIAKPYWSRHHNTVPSVTGLVSAQGRIFYILDEAPASMSGAVPDKWVLVARDAFNGLPLWRKPIPDWGWKAWSKEWTSRFTVPSHIPKRLVAVGDRLYVTLGFNAPLSEIDAETGEIVRVLEGTEYTDEILYQDGLLILALNKAPQGPGLAESERRGEPDLPPVRKWVAAVDARSGKTLWKTGDFVGLRSKTGSMERISHLSMCVGGGRVYFVDRDRIVGLDLKNGAEVWNVARPEVPENTIRYNIRITDMGNLVYHSGMLYFAQLNPDREIDWREIRGRLHALDAKTGKEAWNHPCASWGWGHPADIFATNGLLWIHDYQSSKRSKKEARPSSAKDLASGNSWVGSRSSFILGLDLKTGEIKSKVSSFKAFDNGHHHRCYRNKATPNFMMTGFRGIEFIPWDGDEIDLNHWVRGTCRLGPMPCNGLVYTTLHPCDCYISSKLNGFLSLAPAEKRRDQEHKTKETTRLTQGPAYKKIDIHPASFTPHPSKDWPIYRHDIERSGITPSVLSPKLQKLWESDMGARPSASVAVGDKIFLSQMDFHQVAALDAKDGKILWTFASSGEVDTPPTIHEGRVYFGCSNGYVYCLTASDGELVWKYHGAPETRLVGSFDGVESAWPIHGSLLVQGDVVYAVAGRSSFLDGGIRAFSLNARTGEVLKEMNLSTPHDIKVANGRSQLPDTGMLSDILVSHEGSIFMRRHNIFPCDGASPQSGGPLRSTAGLLDDSWFSRARWHLDNKAVAEYCVFNDSTLYGIGARSSMNVNGGFFTPGEKGYELFALDRNPAPAQSPKGKKKKPASAKLWSVNVPVRVTSMVLAGEILFAAGTPDEIDPKAPWAVYEGKRGGVLLTISAKNGKELARYRLDSPPVLDGLTVARGRLFVSTQGGKILSFGEEIGSPTEFGD